MELGGDQIEHMPRKKRSCCKKKSLDMGLDVDYINETVYLDDISVPWLLSLAWHELIIGSAATSIVVILFFTLLFDQLDGIENIEDSFALSTQTFLTIGYGTLAPHTLWGHTIVWLETFVSVMVLAIVTGIPYIQFSKPSSHLTFANPIIHQGTLGAQLQFRLALNTNGARLLDARFRLTLAHTERSPVGTVCTSGIIFIIVYLL